MHVDLAVNGDRMTPVGQSPTTSTDRVTPARGAHTCAVMEHERY